MNIAVVFNKEMRDGGAFQYALSISLLLEKNSSGVHKFIYFTTAKNNPDVLTQYGIRPVYLPWSNLDRFKTFISGSLLAGNIFSAMKLKPALKLDRIFKKHGVDLVYFLSPTDMALALNRYNYIFTVWDLCFFDFMEFPEVYVNREFERRENIYRLAITKAVAVITDSERTAANIVKRYGVEERRAVSLPLLPSDAVDIAGLTGKDDAVDIKHKYGIGERYIFYPAQFWPHKNHTYILEGLRLLKSKHNIKVDAVFAGSDKGNLSFILNKAREFGIADQIHCIGFVKNEELPCLYRQALALVMPTYFGPSNIPPIEAFVTGCPVLCSDLPGLREQVEGAAILLDLNDPYSMCSALIDIIKNPARVDAMVQYGKDIVKKSSKEDRWNKLKNVFDAYEIKMKCWR